MRVGEIYTVNGDDSDFVQIINIEKDVIDYKWNFMSVIFSNSLSNFNERFKYDERLTELYMINDIIVGLIMDIESFCDTVIQHLLRIV